MSLSTIRRSLAILALIFLTGCSNMKIDAFAGKSPEFRPEEFFLGKTVAFGFFKDRFGTVHRQFRVDIDGSMQDGKLVLDEDFVYDDGETDKRIWTLEIGPDGTYRGTAGDVIGVAEGQARGNALNFKYTFELPINGRIWHVFVDDWMYQQSQDVMLNRSTLSKWGLTFGEIFITFYRQPDAS